MTIPEVRDQIKLVARSSGPIIVGPWMSEVGFELLYWIPFLRWAVAYGHIDRKRLWVISRGGCRSWYADITTNYLDLYEDKTPDDIRALNQRRIREQSIKAKANGLRRGQVTAKQYVVTTVELPLVERLARRAGVISSLANVNLLHPSLMYRAFRPIWRRRLGIYGEWSQYARARRMEAPPASLDLPERFVAVKFYASQACKDDHDRRIDVQRIVDTIRETSDVVLLHTGTKYDEHGEFPIETHPRVHRLTFQPGTNLDQQTEIVARSSGFVGTYGGFAYLAPLLCVPTVALYSLQNFRGDHFTLMSTVAHRDLNTSFRVVNIRQGVEAVRRVCHRWGVAHAA